MTEKQMDRLCSVLDGVFVSPSVSDANFEAANLVDTTQRIANGVGILADAITPRGASPGKDAFGGHVGSLTEAVMGVANGLSRIADAIESLGEKFNQ